MALKIGEIRAWRSPQDFKFIPDDRQTLIQTDGGAIVQDYGHVGAGDKLNFSAVFKKKDFLTLWNYWQERQFVDITDTGGNIWKSCRIKILSYGYEINFEDFINVELEIWRI